ncbi:hypothetical protein ACWD5R_30220 [Streptomyces sp. NPDC002514]|uniref:hypothetical protein n=1 Tax=unclassified Streptomyces TaxID=2593676 RepID=UPI0036C9EB7A
MTKRIAKASVGILMAVVSATGILTAGAGTASAATLQNTLEGSYYGTPWLTPYMECHNEELDRNKKTYGNEAGGGNEYFYCALGDRGLAYNLWWRHYV